MAAAVSRWPFCAAKAIAAPFRGFGLGAPDHDREAESDEGYERLLELPCAVERGLPEISRGFHDARFVFIDADCFGGTCIYTGFVVQAGEVRLEARIALADFLQRVEGFELATDGPWEPRQALSVHGPSRLPIRLTPSPRAASPA